MRFVTFQVIVTFAESPIPWTSRTPVVRHSPSSSSSVPCRWFILQIPPNLKSSDDCPGSDSNGFTGVAIGAHLQCCQQKPHYHTMRKGNWTIDHTELMKGMF